MLLIILDIAIPTVRVYNNPGALGVQGYSMIDSGIDSEPGSFRIDAALAFRQRDVPGSGAGSGRWQVYSVSRRHRELIQRDTTILQAAQEILSEVGYYGLTMESVARKSSLRRGQSISASAVKRMSCSLWRNGPCASVLK